jgi:hypothetical protein
MNIVALQDLVVNRSGDLGAAMADIHHQRTAGGIQKAMAVGIFDPAVTGRHGRGQP